MKCNPNCIYFPTTETVVSEAVVDGVKHRKVIRRCAFDARKIETWEEGCHREDGPLFAGDSHE